MHLDRTLRVQTQELILLKRIRYSYICFLGSTTKLIPLSLLNPLASTMNTVSTRDDGSEAVIRVYPRSNLSTEKVNMPCSMLPKDGQNSFLCFLND